MNEKPLERLNYYNGQRLEATDLKTEQEYHIRTKRWLNKSLYSAGIARGLEVRAVPGAPSVVVSPGLALDSDGREIILLEETPVEVISYAGTDESTVVGNYLVIEYAEETIAYEQGGCAVRAEGMSANKSTTNWGGPSRIQAQVNFSWVPFVPHPGSNQIVLARVELTAPNCDSVHQIDAGARRYIGAASAATVRQYALEGEREVAFIPKEAFPTLPAPVPQPTDINVVGRIYFQIRGRQPSSVTLYLKADVFSPLLYTELGAHIHPAIDGTLQDHHISQSDVYHSHALDHVITDEEKADDRFFDGVNWFAPHQHWVNAKIGNLGTDSNQNLFKFDLSHSSDPAQVVDNDVDLHIYMGKHRHRLIKDGPVDSHDPAKTEGPTEFQDVVLSHTSSTSGSISPSGVLSPSRTGAAFTFVDDLQVSIGPVGSVMNRTTEIREQLANSIPIDWRNNQGEPRKLGDGSGNHVIALKGTGPIRLDFLPGVTFVGGEYCITLEVDAKTEAGKRVPNGGKIHYNLYVE